jgi:hypothetical protein
MRRIAIAAALAATLAGGAAALAATPDPAGTDATPPPDPYQGAWQLVLDGKPAGPVVNVDGCALEGQVVASLEGTQKHVAAVAPEPCTFDVGAGMSPAFTTWLNDSLTRGATVHDAQLVRTDARPGYALELPRAMVAAVALPKVDRAATTPLYLHVTLAGDQVRRIPASIPEAARMRPFAPSSLALTVDGRPVPATSVGPWSATIDLGGDAGTARARLAHGVAIGDLPIRVPEAPSTAGSAGIADWAHAVLVDGMTAAAYDRPVAVALNGLTLALGNAGPDRADLVPRADGARTYDLYAESAGLTATK